VAEYEKYVQIILDFAQRGNSKELFGNKDEQVEHFLLETHPPNDAKDIKYQMILVF
jgi:hypothetical protein